MKPYELINCILQQTFSEVIPFEIEHLVFDNNLRWQYDRQDNINFAKLDLSADDYYDYYHRTWRDKWDNNTLYNKRIKDQYRILPHIIDHSYDNEPDDWIRINKVCKELQHILNLYTPAQFYEATVDNTLHNQRLLKNKYLNKETDAFLKSWIKDVVN